MDEITWEMILQIVHSFLKVDYDNDSSVEFPIEWRSLFSVSKDSNEDGTLEIAQFSLEDLT